MFFTRKCTCGNKPVIHIKIVPYMGEEVKVPYCQKCYDNELAWQKEQKETWEKLKKERAKEQEKQQRYEYLKREIELGSLKKKPKNSEFVGDKRSGAMFKKGEELIHPKYGKCVLLEEATDGSRCVIVFEKPIISNITELVTDITCLKKR